MADSGLRSPTVSVPAAAAILGISSCHLYICVHRGEVHAAHLGQRYQIPVTELDRLLGHQVDQTTLDWGKLTAAERVRKARALGRTKAAVSAT